MKLHDIVYALLNDRNCTDRWWQLANH